MKRNRSDGNKDKIIKSPVALPEIDTPKDGKWHPVCFKTWEERREAMIKAGVIDADGNLLDCPDPPVDENYNNLKFEFAPTVKIKQFEKIAVDFLKNIFEINYYECFISDECFLMDFDSYTDDDDYNARKIEIINKVLHYYNIDITDNIKDPLWVIFEKIDSIIK